MRQRVLALVSLFLIICGLTTEVDAQKHTAPAEHISTYSSFWDRFTWVDADQMPVHELSFLGGHSFESNRGVWGKIPATKLDIYSIRYNRRLLLFNNRHLIEYIVELNMAADYNLTDNQQIYPARHFTGLGIAPIGFQFNWNRNRVVQPFFKTSGGFMYFNDPFPDKRGVKFNFTLDLGMGLEFMIAQNASLTIGYKYHHMSNAHTGQINPGVDSNVFYTGFTVF